MNNTFTKIGIIGLGAITKYYLSSILNVKNKIELVALCDIDSKKLTRFKTQCQYTTTSLDEILSLDSIDAVIINLPNDLHYEACRKAILAGKHVCCEKPLALLPTQADELEKLAKQNHILLYTAFHRRHNVHVKKLNHIINNLKNIKQIRVRYFEKIEDHCGDNAWYLNPQRCGGGVIADNGPNVVDLVNYLIGDFKVTQSLIAYTQPDIDTKAIILGETNDNLQITMQLDWEYQHGECKDIIIICEDGTSHSVNMLDGFQEFKSSLFHEYAEILDEFVSLIDANDKIQRSITNHHGTKIVHLINHIYQMGSNVSEEAIYEYFK